MGKRRFQLNMLRLYMGSAALLLVFLLASFGVGSLYLEKYQLSQAIVYPEFVPGKPTLISGELSIENLPIIEKQLVSGVKEAYIQAQQTAWKKVQASPVNLKLITPQGHVLTIYFEDPSPRGQYKTVNTSGSTRWRGYEARQALSVLATVSTERPLRFEALKHCGGDLSDYKQFLEKEVALSQGVSLFFIVICLEVMFFPDRIQSAESTN